MKTRSAIPLRALISFALVWAAVFLFSLSDLQFQIDRIVEKTETGWKELPAKKTFDAKENAIYRTQGRVFKRILNTPYVRIFTDDCLLSLKINSKEVPLKDIISGDACKHYEAGHIAKLGPFLNPGENTILAEYKNEGGPAAFDIKPAFVGLFKLLAIILLMLATILLFVGRLPSFNGVTWIFLAAAFLVFNYTFETPIDLRSHDIEGHLEFLKILQDTGTLPLGDKCWECHQQPLYYYIFSGIGKILDKYNSEDVFQYVLQLSSNFFYLLFLLFVAKTISLLKLRHPGWIFALIALWPAGILHSARGGNDVPVYALIAAAFYYLVTFNLLHKIKDLWFAMVFLFAGVLTKLTSVLLVPVFVATVLMEFNFVRNLIQLPKQKKRFSNTTLILFLLISVASIKLAFDSRRIVSGNPAQRGVNISKPQSELLVENHAHNFLYFDWKGFLIIPRSDPWADETGRQYFWNSLIKTSSLGEFNIHNDFNRELGVFLAIFVLIVYVSMGYLIFRFIFFDRQKFYKYIFPILLFISSVALLAAYRYKYSYACNNDLRFIYPLVISFALLDVLPKNYLRLLVTSLISCVILFHIALYTTGVY